MHIPRQAWLMVSATLLFAAAVDAQQFGRKVYTLSGSDRRLRSVDPLTGQTLSNVVLSLPTVNASGATGLAREPATGVLYAVLKTPSGRMLATIDAATGVAIPIGILDHDFASIAFRGPLDLVGVTGDGASPPEALYTIGITTAATTFVVALGTGTDGEAIAHNPDDGLLYHASGTGVPNLTETFDWISIGPSGVLIMPIPLAGADYNEATAMAYAGANTFYLTDSNSGLYTVTTTGFVTPVGTLPAKSKGLVYDPGSHTLISVANNTSSISVLNAATGSLVSSKPIVVGPFLDAGIAIASPPGSKQVFGLVSLMGQSTAELVTISTLTGQVTLIGDTGDQFADLAFAPDGRLYGVTSKAAATPSALFAIDPDTAATTFVTAFGAGSAGEAIAFRPTDGRIYHAAGTGTPNDVVSGEVLEAYDPISQQVTPITLSGADYNQATAMSHWVGQTFLITDLNNRLFVLSASGAVLQQAMLDHTPVGVTYTTGVRQLYSVRPSSAVQKFTRHNDDLSAAASFPITVPGFSVGTANGLAAHPLTNELYAILNVSGSFGRLLARLDPATGNGVAIGDTGDKFAGITFDAQGTLYGVTGDGASVPESLFKIDINTGATTFVLSLGNGSDGEAIAYHDPSGLIFHTSGSPSVYESINPQNGAVTNIPISGPGLGEVTAITQESEDVFLLVAFDDFYRITPSGKLALVATAPFSMKGLAYLDAPSFVPYGEHCAGSGGFAPSLAGVGTPSPGNSITLEISGGLGGAPALMLLGIDDQSAAINPACSLHIAPLLPATIPLTLIGVGPGAGGASIGGTLPPATPSGSITLQALVADPGASFGVAATNALRMTIGI